MIRLRLALAAMLVGCGAAPQLTPSTPQPPPAAPGQAHPIEAVSTHPAAHGVDLAAMDTSVAPGDDFYSYAYGGFMRTQEIPPDHAAVSAMRKVVDLVELQTRALVESAAWEASDLGTDRGKVGALYQSFMNEAAIEARGLAPLKPQLDAIANVKDRAGLSALLGSFVRADVDVLNCTHTATDRPLGLWVEQDLNDPRRNTAYLLQGGLGMPDRVYYLEGGKYEELRKAYESYIARLFQLSGDDETRARAKAARALAFEVRLARTHASRTDTGDVSKGNNPATRAELETKAKGMDWRAFLTAAGLDKQPTFILWQPSGIAGLSALVASEPISTWKEYLAARALDRFASVLPKAFAEASFAFHGTALSGVTQRPERWKEGVGAVNAALGMELGHLYVDKFFSPETKAEISAMVENIRAAFERRIEHLDWMSDETKSRAKAKVKALKVGIGYPDTWRDASGLTVTPEDIIGNLERASSYEYQRNLKKLGAPPDRGEWCMLPHQASAVNLPVRNAIHFPAGFIQLPVYDKEATAAVRYGAYGSVIGHEVSHSFDNTGAAFDDEGRFRNWWTPADLQHFQAAAHKLVDQFNQYRPFPDASVNGTLTLGENMADLAGLSAAFDAWNTSLGGGEAPRVDGFTGVQQFFIAFAQRRGAKWREAALRRVLATDGHSPGPWGALTVRNVDAWYSAFGVHEAQSLFLKPAERASVW